MNKSVLFAEAYVYYALTDGSPYRSKSPESAFDFPGSVRSKSFDPSLADAFISTRTEGLNNRDHGK